MLTSPKIRLPIPSRFNGATEHESAAKTERKNLALDMYMENQSNNKQITNFKQPKKKNDPFDMAVTLDKQTEEIWI